MTLFWLKMQGKFSVGHSSGKVMMFPRALMTASAKDELDILLTFVMAGIVLVPFAAITALTIAELLMRAASKNVT